MLIAIIAVFLFSLAPFFFYKRNKRVVAAFLFMATVAVVAYFFSFLGPVTRGETFEFSFEWLPSLDISLSFYLDGLSLFFALLISLFGAFVLLYSFKYMKGYPHEGRFYGYMLLFMGSMLGVVLSANMISLFVFWELTSFSSFLLIGFNNQEEESRKAARQAFLVTSGGGLALMSGFILLEMMTPTGFNIPELLNQPGAISGSSLSTAAIILTLLGAATKSAQFPFHFWLPNAMAAPTPVSAYLHSATMVKAGVYLVFRLNPVFQDVTFWSVSLLAIGAVTMTWAAFKALQADDLKRVLAFTTVSALGIFFMMTGFGSSEAANAAMIYVMAHALYKGALFLSAGNIDHETGTRNISELSDLGKKMPYTATAALMSVLSMAGVIPFLGFVGKESLYDSILKSGGQWAPVSLILLFIASAFFTAVSIDIAYNIFFRKGPLREKKIHRAPFLMFFPPLLMGIAGLATGLLPGHLAEPLLNYSAAAIHGMDPSMELKLWHGFNLVFILSLATLAAGAGVYFTRKLIRRMRKPAWMSTDYVYDLSVHITESFAAAQTRILQSGQLRNYIAVFTGFFSLILVYLLFAGDFMDRIDGRTILKDLQIYEVVILALIAVATILLLRSNSRLVVSATYGIIGYSIALGYTLFSAPDVAITQFLAETLTLILLILILHGLPRYHIPKLGQKKRYISVAVFFGLIMTVISYVITGLEAGSPLKEYFLEKSVPEGKGENVVNVILVDFRALDTLGEISVLTITMLGIIALLKINSEKKKI